MENNSSISLAKKQDTGLKTGSDISQKATRTRQKRGSISQSSVSLVDCPESSNLCNGVSTSGDVAPKSHSASLLSSSEPLISGRQRRSARLSQMESQPILQTPEKKKKMNAEFKTPGKDKRKGKMDKIIDDCGSEKSVSNKRTPGKAKKNTFEVSVESEKCAEEEDGGEPAEKRAKRASRRSSRKESAMQDDCSIEEKQTDKGDEAEISRNVSFKSGSKHSLRKKTIDESSSAISEQQNVEKVKKDSISLKQDQALKIPTRKKCTAFEMSSTLESTCTREERVKQNEGSAKHSKISKVEDRLKDEIQNEMDDMEEDKFTKSSHNTKMLGENEFESALKLGINYKGSPNTSNAEAKHSKIKSGSALKSQPLKAEKVSKEFSSSNMNDLSFGKDDLVQEYNRSISEKISLLKPKAFVGRFSAGFRKSLDDHCDGSGQEVDSDAESRRAIMESAQRRIEQNLSTSESDSRLFRGMHTPLAHNSKNDSSESDSAPEAVSFSNARQDALESIKSAAEHLKHEKQRLKERRKARLEMLKQQKEEKLIRLKEKMASQEDASCSSSEESGYEEEIRNARQKLKKKKAKSKTQRTEKENLDDAIGQTTSRPLSGAASDDSSGEEAVAAKEAASLGSLKQVQKEMFQSNLDVVNSKTQKVGNSSNNRSFQEDKLKKKKSKFGRIEESDKKDRGFKSLTSLDYIPLSTEGATKFMVVPLEKAMRAPKTLAEEAADFRQNMLYSSRIKREPGKIVAAYQQKLVASGKNFHVR